MDVRIRVVAGVAILYLEGRLVTSSRPGRSLRAIVCDQVHQGRLVVLVDMAGVTDIDAHGLGSLVSSLTTLERHGGRMALVAPTDHVRHLLAITRLDTVFEVYDFEREALVRRRPIVVPAAGWPESALLLDGGTARRLERPELVQMSQVSTDLSRRLAGAECGQTDTATSEAEPTGSLV